MWPVIANVGIFQIYALPLFVAAAIFWAGFVFWRLLHQSARYKEFEIFDALLWSSVLGVICGRLFHIAVHAHEFGWQFWHWLDILHYPGVSIFCSIFAAGFIFWRWLAFQKITDLELLDYWVRGVCFALILYHVGLFFDGSGSGYYTLSPLGLVFPGATMRVYPAQLYAAAFFTLIYFFLVYLEKNYRTYNWYRGSRSQAKSGFVFFAFTAIYAIYELFALNYRPVRYHFASYSLDWIFYLSVLLLDLLCLYVHAFARRRPKVKKKSKK